jgi:transglutaminase-like putative cysteine protease
VEQGFDRLKQSQKRRAEGKTPKYKVFLYVLGLVLSILVIIGSTVVLDYLDGARLVKNKFSQTVTGLYVRELDGYIVATEPGRVYTMSRVMTFSAPELVSRERFDLEFQFSVAPGFSAITANDPRVRCTPSSDGNTVRIQCSDWRVVDELVLELTYPSSAISMSKEASGSYRWRLNDYLSAENVELSQIAAEFISVYGAIDWVNRNVKHIDQTATATPQPDFYTAITGRGDCDDKAILICSLLSRMDPPIEASIVEGFKMTDDGRFAFHAINEIRVGDQWIRFDVAESGKRVLKVSNFFPGSDRHALETIFAKIAGTDIIVTIHCDMRLANFTTGEK